MTESESTPSSRRGTVLVLDDDPSIRDVVRKVLERNGFRVLEAENAQEAFRRVDARPGGVDLIICDLVLPGLDGREAGNALQARAPGTPILFTSGYSSFTSGRRQIQQAGQPFLPKPFSVEALVEAVEELLDQAG